MEQVDVPTVRPKALVNEPDEITVLQSTQTVFPVYPPLVQAADLAPSTLVFE